ncbi:MAG: hypothetical protein KIT83_16730 [Bryobacterales bacterium]|nr:hypothetical protein [Bryobacterales bacterium]
MPFRTFWLIALALHLFVPLSSYAQAESFGTHFQRAASSFREERFDHAKRSAIEARKAAANADQRQRADKLLQSIETAVLRRKAADQLANRVGLLEEDLPAAASADHSRDLSVDAERLDQTLTVFTRDQGGKVVEGTLKELQCREGNARIVVEAEGKPVTVEIDQPGDILITRAGEHTKTFDFRCGKQKPEIVKVGYRPAASDGKVGFLRILQFEK